MLRSTAWKLGQHEYSFDGAPLALASPPRVVHMLRKRFVNLGQLSRCDFDWEFILYSVSPATSLRERGGAKGYDEEHVKNGAITGRGELRTLLVRRVPRPATCDPSWSLDGKWMEIGFHRLRQESRHVIIIILSMRIFKGPPRLRCYTRMSYTHRQFQSSQSSLTTL
ncbi:hypothetical protein VTN77DRAFT_3867 [Rasamsonia byssochlamydoides]|uniref:uncharacterized protein n=1 Tax=Rasamsonia byssochlamydoides TaxID=89139 RepID=UPI003741F8B5